MPPGVSLQSNFTAGELSPAMLGRVEMDKFRDGARTMRNFLVQSHGPAVKRPGFVLLGQLPGQAVLLEFVFNNDQTYALIFGDYWLRVAMHGGFVLDGNGNPYQIASPYSLEQAKQLSFVQSADVLFIACQGVRPQKLKRLGHANWQFEGMTFTEPLPAPEWGSDVVESTAYELAYPANTVYYMKGSGWTSRYELVTYDLYRKLDPNLVTPNYVLAFAKDTAYIQDGYEPNSDDPIYTPIGIALYRRM